MEKLQKKLVNPQKYLDSRKRNNDKYIKLTLDQICATEDKVTGSVQWNETESSWLRSLKVTLHVDAVRITSISPKYEGDDWRTEESTQTIQEYTHHFPLLKSPKGNDAFGLRYLRNDKSSYYYVPDKEHLKNSKYEKKVKLSVKLYKCDAIYPLNPESPAFCELENGKIVLLDVHREETDLDKLKQENLEYEQKQKEQANKDLNVWGKQSPKASPRIEINEVHWLKEGVHQFPFELPVSEAAPPSYRAFGSEKKRTFVHAYIEVDARFETLSERGPKPVRYTESNYISEAVNIWNRRSTYLPKQLLKPSPCSVNFCKGEGNALLSVRASIKTNIWRLGDTIPIDVNVTNDSSTKLRCIKLTLICAQLTKNTPENSHITTETKKILKIVAPDTSVAPNGGSLNKTLEFKLPSEGMLHPTIACQVLQLKYHIEVRADIPWARDIRENLEIILIPRSAPELDPSPPLTTLSSYAGNAGTQTMEIHQGGGYNPKDEEP